MTKRRGRGEGSIYQRKIGARIYWVAEVSLGVDSEGTRHRSKPIYGKTKEEVLEKLKSVGMTSPSVANAPKDVAELLKLYIESSKRAEDTVKHYRWAAEHVGRHIGGVKLSKLHAAQINLCYKALMNHGSSRLPSMAHEVLRGAIKWGKLAGYITSDPLAAVASPRRIKRKFTVWSEEQTRTFLEKARDTQHRLEALFILAGVTGAREAELFGARWCDIDLEKRTWSINRQLVEVDGKVYPDSNPKTESSRRTIVIPEVALAALRRHRLRCQVEAVEWQEHELKLQQRRKKKREHRAYKDGKLDQFGIVFTSKMGSYLRKGRFMKEEFHALRQTLGLPHIRFHDLRHGIATHLLSKNVHPKKVSELLGHANTKITMDTYSHVLGQAREEVAAEADAIFGSNSAVKNEKGGPG